MANIPLTVEDATYRGKRLGDMNREELMNAVNALAELYQGAMIQHLKELRDLDEFFKN